MQSAVSATTTLFLACCGRQADSITVGWQATGWVVRQVDELAREVGRLADAAERLLRTHERRDREQHHALLEASWGTSAWRRLDTGLLLEAIPGLAAHLSKIVPSEFVAQTGDGEMTVACPCGHDPVARAGMLTSCECGRWFLYDGRDVHVALSPNRHLTETSA